MARDSRKLLEHSKEISTIKETMAKITANSLEAKYDTYKQVSEAFEQLKIAPVVLCLYNRLIETYARPAERRQ